MKKLGFIALMLGVLFLLVGCAPHSGTIHDKRHTEGHYYTSTQCHTIGKTTNCVPMTHYAQPSWAFDLYHGKDHGWRDVSEDTYNRFQVGDEYSDGKK